MTMWFSTEDKMKLHHNLNFLFKVFQKNTCTGHFLNADLTSFSACQKSSKQNISTVAKVTMAKPNASFYLDMGIYVRMYVCLYVRMY